MDNLDKQAEKLAEMLDISVTDIEIIYTEGKEEEAEFQTPAGTYSALSEQDKAEMERNGLIADDFLNVSDGKANAYAEIVREILSLEHLDLNTEEICNQAMYDVNTLSDMIANTVEVVAEAFSERYNTALEAEVTDGVIVLHTDDLFSQYEAEKLADLPETLSEIHHDLQKTLEYDT